MSFLLSLLRLASSLLRLIGVRSRSNTLVREAAERLAAGDARGAIERYQDIAKIELGNPRGYDAVSRLIHVLAAGGADVTGLAEAYHRVAVSFAGDLRAARDANDLAMVQAGMEADINALWRRLPGVGAPRGASGEASAPPGVSDAFATSADPAVNLERSRMGWVIVSQLAVVMAMSVIAGVAGRGHGPPPAFMVAIGMFYISHFAAVVMAYRLSRARHGLPGLAAVAAFLGPLFVPAIQYWLAGKHVTWSPAVPAPRAIAGNPPVTSLLQRSPGSAAPAQAERATDGASDQVMTVRFHIDLLGGFAYGRVAWQTVFAAIPPTALAGAELREGDSRGTLAGTDRVYCIELRGPRETLHRAWDALAGDVHVRASGVEPQLVLGSTGDPLVSCGRIDAAGCIGGSGADSGWALPGAAAAMSGARA